MNNIPGVVIRLQKLPIEAVSSDVRQFFRGLNIPDGGVHIIGGRDGDAFIVFASDEDARQAMRRDGDRIKDARVKLFLSSRVEMQQIIEKARMEMQQGANPHAFASDTRRGESSHSGRHRRSRSRDRHHRRSRSRSPDRGRSRGSGANQSSRHDSKESNQPPPHTPAAPISGYSSYRNQPPEAGLRYAQPGRGVLDRTGPLPSPNVDSRFLDRGPPPPKPASYLPVRPEYAPQVDIGLGNFGMGQSNKSGPGGSVRMPATSAEGFGGPTHLIRPGGMVPPPFMPGGPNKYNEPTPFAGSAIRGPMDPRFEAPVDAVPPNRSHKEPVPLFGVSQKQAPPPPSSNRASRRALLPAPEDTAEPVPDFGGDRQQRNFDGPVPGLFPPAPNTDINQRPPPQQMLAVRQFLNPPKPTEWPMESSTQPQPAIGFGFNPAPQGRPTLLQQPKSDVGLSILMTAVPVKLQRYGAIREFFHPLDLEGPDKIKIGVDERGERTGQVYCKFLTTDDAGRALAYTGRDNIYIRSCSDEEFERAVDGGLVRQRSTSRDRDSDSSRRSHREDSHSRPTNKDNAHETGYSDFVIEVSNIPYKAVQRDLVHIFGPFNPVEIRRLYKHHHANGKVVTSDTAFVIFENEKDVQAAIRMRDRRLLDRDLRLIRCTTTAMEDTFKRAPPAPPEALAEWNVRKESGSSRDRRYDDRPDRRSPPLLRSPPRRVLSPQLPYQIPSAPYERPAAFKPELVSKMSPISTSTPVLLFTHTCVCMKGVPMNATNRDVASFFGGLNIAPNGIRILKGTPGMVYVEFATSRDCEQALTKDRSYIGTQMATVRPCSKDEMMEAVHKQFGLNGNGGGNSPQMQPATSGEPIPAPSIHLHEQLFGNPGQALQSSQIFGAHVIDPQPQSTFADQEQLLYFQQLQALAKQQEEIRASANVGGRLQMDLGEQELATGGSSTFSAPDSSDMPPIDPEVVCSIGVPGCVAALHNLPPTITLEEICELFQGYQLIEDSIRMHYSNTGEPTGDCLLAFATSQDAEKAVANLNGTAIDGQVVRMYVVPV